MKPFVILLALTLGLRFLRSAGNHASEAQLGAAFVGWVLGCVLLAAVWRFA